jgi:Ca-activated chloride channel family protein
MKRIVIPFLLAIGLVALAQAQGRHAAAVTPTAFGGAAASVPLRTASAQLPPPPAGAAHDDGRGSLKMVTHLSDPLLLAGDARSEFFLADVFGQESAPTAKERTAMNVAVALDCSGSMQGEKIDNARRAAHELVNQLGAQDRLAFITFGSSASTLFPSTPCTAEAKVAMHAALDRFDLMGGTNISQGLQLAREQVAPQTEHYPVNRVILISDGLANEGVTTKPGLVDLSRTAKHNGITVTALGVGTDFDEDLMEQLAENGGGNYGFLRTGGDLTAMFHKELTQMGTLVASSPRLTLHLADGVQVAEVYGYASEADAQGNVGIQLYDVAANAHFRVMVRLVVSARAAGAAHLVDARLDYTDVLHDRVPVFATASVDAEVTDDAPRAAAGRDRTLYRQVIEGSAASLSKGVASRFSSGDIALAQRELTEARSQMNRLIAKFGAQDSQAEVDRMLPAAPLPSSSQSEAGRVQTIQMHRNIIDFASKSTAQGS